MARRAAVPGALDQKSQQYSSSVLQLPQKGQCFEPWNLRWQSRQWYHMSDRLPVQISSSHVRRTQPGSAGLQPGGSRAHAHIV